MAIAASVTVSIAALTIGMLSVMLREKRESTLTSRGRMSEKLGTRRTSSYVKPSPINFVVSVYIALNFRAKIPKIIDI